MQSWTWPKGVSIDLFHWSWMDSAAEELTHGWSLDSEPDAAGNVQLEAERSRSTAARYQVDPAGYPDVQRHTFHSAAELPIELLSFDGTPLVWLRQLIDRHTTPRPNPN
jgi:hypothetical protein